MGKIVLLFLITFFISSCGNPNPPPSPIVGNAVADGPTQTVELQTTTESVQNCGGGDTTIIKHPSMTTLTSHSIQWEVGGQLGVGGEIGGSVIPGGVDLNSTIQSSMGQTFNSSGQQSTAWDLPASPNSINEYKIQWREVWQPAHIDVSLADGKVVRVNVKYRTGIQSDIINNRKLSCNLTTFQGASTQEGEPVPTSASQPSSSLCFGNCWNYDTNGHTMTWTGLSDGTEDIWQPAGDALNKIRNGYTAIITTTVPGEIFSCVLNVNGRNVISSCGIFLLPPGTYQIKSASTSIGGFRWCPQVGVGYRASITKECQ